MIILYIIHCWTFCLPLGFIFINCTSSNGTNISQWVYEANNTLCIEPTTPPITSTDSMTSHGKETVSIRPSTNITPYNQTTSNRDDPWCISKWKLTLLQWIPLCHFLFLFRLCLHKKHHVINNFNYFSYWQICLSLVSFITKTGHLPIIGGVLTALVFLLIIGVAVVCSQRKKQSNKPKGIAFISPPLIDYFCLLKRIDWHVRKLTDSLSCWELDEKIDVSYILVKYQH